MKQGSCLARLFDKSIRNFYARNQYCSLNALPRLGQFLKGEKMKTTDHKTTAADMAALYGNLTYKGIYDIPLSFCYGGKNYRGFSEDMSPKDTFRRIDSNFTLTCVSARLDSLEIRVEYKEYKDFPMTEWVAYFENVSNESSKILSDIRIASGVLCGNDLSLTYSNGDDLSVQGYSFFEHDLSEKFELCPNASGTPCAGAAPYMRLHGREGGYNIAVGWSGRWTADFEKTDGGVNVAFGQKRCNLYLKPGEIFRTPRVNIESYVGDEHHARNMWRRFYMKHILPKDRDGSVLHPKLCLHLFGEGGKPEFSGATEQGQLKALHSYLEKGLKPDIWWLDAGWYPCDYHWDHTGTWEANPVNWPNGIEVLGDECEKQGIDFLLWFEPERVRAGSWLDEHHPEWLLKNGNPDDANRLLDYSNKEALNWLINHIDGLIKKFKVKIYRQDFNFDPMPCWENNETEDRLGALENFHIQGYYHYWDELINRNPGLWMDSCASGGRRNDPETMRRGVPLHYTDVGYGDHAIKQKQHRYMFEWIPYFRAHNRSWDVNGEMVWFSDDPFYNFHVDDFCYQLACAPALTDIIVYDADDKSFEIARRNHPIWRRAARFMTKADYYPLTEPRFNLEDFYAMEFYEPKTKSGFFQVVSNIKVKEPSFTVRLTLDDGIDYKVENSATGETRIISGKQLSEGLEVALSPRTGIIFFFEPAEN